MRQFTIDVITFDLNQYPFNGLQIGLEDKFQASLKIEEKQAGHPGFASYVSLTVFCEEDSEELREYVENWLDANYCDILATYPSI